MQGPLLLLDLGLRRDKTVSETQIGRRLASPRFKQIKHRCRVGTIKLGYVTLLSTHFT